MIPTVEKVTEVTKVQITVDPDLARVLRTLAGLGWVHWEELCKRHVQGDLLDRHTPHEINTQMQRLYDPLRKAGIA